MKQRNRLFVIILLLIISSLSITLLASPTESEVLALLFSEGPEQVTYTTQFQASVPLATVKQITDQIAGQLGSFVDVEGAENPYSVVFDGGVATTYVVLDSQGRIAGLQITEIIPSGVTLADAVAQIVAMEGTASVLIRKNGEVLVAHNSHVPLAVGSTFKLGVLAAVDDAVRQGKLSWAQSVALEPNWKSLPTGVLQDWPNGSHVTVETLATLMISISDNTAADALFSLVGRKEVEKYIPSTIVSLTTGELFRLKNPDNQDLLAQYRNASTAGRRRIVDKLTEQSLPSSNIFSGNPIALDIEWYMTAVQLADLIERLEGLDLTTIHPGLASSNRWQRVAYKGGSEPGVLNLTSFLLDADGNRYTVVVTVNNPKAPLAENDIISAYQAILNKL